MRHLIYKMICVIQKLFNELIPRYQLFSMVSEVSADADDLLSTRDEPRQRTGHDHFLPHAAQNKLHLDSQVSF